MTLRIAFHPKKAILAASLALAGVATPSWALTPEEASTGAAAAVVVAQKCSPQQTSVIRQYAFDHLKAMLRDWGDYERSVVLDSADMKVKALSISSADAPCSGIDHLRTMVRQWGFGHLLSH